MAKSLDKIKVILIGGTSHTGKTTLGKAIAKSLNWDYIATDSLAKHPGRPWVSTNDKTVKKHVAEHYKNLSIPELVTDVLRHYARNVLPLVETLVQIYCSNSANQCLVIEGSALFPTLVKDLVARENVRGFFLVSNYSCLKNRVFANSNFYSVGKAKQYLIYKFLERTWFYNQLVINESKSLKFNYINVDFQTTDCLVNKCLKAIDIV